MKLYYAVWLLSATTALAQTSGQTTVPNTTRPGLTISREAANDKITLTNNMTVQGKVTRRDARNLYYTKPGDTGGKEQELLLSRIEQIQYADGRVEKLAGKAGKPPVQSGGEYAVASQVTATTSESSFNRIHVTIGPELAYYASPLNNGKNWASDSLGFGMKQNIGGSLRVDYLLLRQVGFSMTVGYFNWELQRNYTRNGTAEYTETKRIRQIPVQVGVKLYPFSTLYVMPEGGINLLSTTVQTSGDHPTPANESVSTTPIVYGGSLGYEFRGKGLLVDLSVRYQMQNVKNLNYSEFKQSLNEQVGVASIRLGIGFGMFKK